jgi:hypothetical protein
MFFYRNDTKFTRTTPRDADFLELLKYRGVAESLPTCSYPVKVV